MWTHLERAPTVSGQKQNSTRRGQGCEISYQCPIRVARISPDTTNVSLVMEPYHWASRVGAFQATLAGGAICPVRGWHKRCATAPFLGLSEPLSSNRRSSAISG